VVLFGLLGQFVQFSWKDDVYSSKIKNRV
jgi:hypothetical protein